MGWRGKRSSRWGRASWLVWACVVASCGDAAETDAGTDAGMDGGADPVVDARVSCESADDCDDGVFCNGAEQCVDGYCAPAESGACGEHACDEASAACRTDCDAEPDADGDGEPAIACGGEDCDDADPTVLPGATEIPADGVDQDCDGGDACFADADGDGFASTDLVVSDDLDCEDPGEIGLDGPMGDCADDDDAINPAATEVVADGVDQDCDGLELCYVDVDGDGFRRDDATVASDDLGCDGEGEADAAAPPGDCDDDDPVRNPFQPELPGDGVDSDCDGTELCYVDADGDGRRSADTSLTLASADLDCDDEGEAAIATPGGDCRDDDPEIYPRRFELCNGVDDNCNGRVDEELSVTGAPSLLPLRRRCGTTDVGHCQYGTETCTGGDWGSCSSVIHPAANELCDGQDWDCDGTTDEGCGCTAGETRPCGSAEGACTQGTQTCSLSGEWGACVGGVTPTAESCNGLDDDCDGETDEPDAEGCALYHVDADDDGYRAASAEPPLCLCAPTGVHRWTQSCPAGGPCTLVAEDCDDDDASVHPGATERCDAIDQDCDGATTERDAMGCTNYWSDVDNDSYGAGSPLCLCAPTGARRATRGGDCCDVDARARPGATAWRSTPTACRPSCNSAATCAVAAQATEAWDYDCDGDAERRWETGAGCHGVCNEEHYGWIGTWPACGSGGLWLDFCSIAPFPPFCLFVPETRTQSCR